VEAAKDQDVRLVAIAKERFKAEEFSRLYWKEPAELYFDSAQEDYPFFRATNGRKQGVAPFVASFLFGGQAAKNWEKGDLRIPNDITYNGGGIIPILGSVMVVSRTGEVLYHFKEEMIGDQPDPVQLKAAIKQLGGTGAVSCEREVDDNEAPDIFSWTFGATTSIPT